jgi:hypothetical protein
MMDWKITYARRWNRETKSFEPAEVEECFAAQDADELIYLIQQAFNDREEIEVELTHHDPTP